MKHLILAFIALAQTCTNAAQQDKHTDIKPEQPAILEHSEHVIIPLRKKNLDDNIIFFGTDASGKPCRKKIAEHAQDNPNFGTIKLVAFHEAYWFFYSYDEFFDDLGTYENEKPLLLFKAHMSNSIDWHAGGVWCPKINTMIGGTKDTGVCDRFVEYHKKMKDSPR